MAKPPIHFLHVSKAGGSAIKYALAAYSDRLGLVLHSHRVTLNSIPSGEKVVFFVRSPVERFVSGFLSRQRQGRPRYWYPWSYTEQIAFGQFSTPNELAEALSGRKDSRQAALNAMAGIRHLARPLTMWLQDSHYLASRLDDIIFIGMQEKLEFDFLQLKKLLDLPGDIALPLDDFNAHRAPADSNRQLSEVGKENIGRWYAEDSKLYDYCCSLNQSDWFHKPT